MNIKQKIYKYEAICSFMISRNVKKHPKKNIYTKQQNQNQPAITFKKKFVFF